MEKDVYTVKEQGMFTGGRRLLTLDNIYRMPHSANISCIFALNILTTFKMMMNVNHSARERARETV